MIHDRGQEMDNQLWNAELMAVSDSFVLFIFSLNVYFFAGIAFGERVMQNASAQSAFYAERGSGGS